MSEERLSMVLICPQKHLCFINQRDRLDVEEKGSGSVSMQGVIFNTGQSNTSKSTFIVDYFVLEMV